MKNEKWISLKSRKKPKKNQDVLAWDIFYGEYYLCRWMEMGGKMALHAQTDQDDNRFAYWMSLPDAPNVEAEDDADAEKLEDDANAEKLEDWLKTKPITI